MLIDIYGKLYIYICYIYFKRSFVLERTRQNIDVNEHENKFSFYI